MMNRICSRRLYACVSRTHKGCGYAVLLAALLVSASAEPRLGMNLAGPADWMTELPFVNVLSTSRVWISLKKGPGWGQGPELALENKAPGQLVASSDRTTSLWQKPIDASISQPKQFGSHQSKLVRHLLGVAAHRERLKPGCDDWLTLVTWVDNNATYHSTLFDVSRYNQTKSFTRVPYALPSPWEPADLGPPFLNKAALAQQEQ